MQQTRLTGAETVRRGQELYDQRLRNQVEAGNHGKFLVINVETGEYEMDADDLAAAKRAKIRFPNARRLLMRIGHPGAYRLGRRWAMPEQQQRALEAREVGWHAADR
jgi:hypothetical protein